MKLVHSNLPGNEVIKNAFRSEERLLPETPVRELLANALIHQDFTATGGTVLVEIYGNRLEVSNPGEPILPVDRFIDEFRSRNERLADLMRRFGICEERSSGIDRVIYAAEECQLPPPEFRASNQRTLVIINGPKEFDEMARDERTRACYQHCVLKFVSQQRMTNLTLRKRFDLPESKLKAVSQMISAAIEAKVIRPDEAVGASRKFARYVPYWA